MKPVLPTYEECINCVLLDEDAKTVMEQLRNKMPVSDFNHIKDMHVLPLKSDPTKEDSDDDGLLDGRAQVNSKGQKIAPKDSDPLIYNGAEGLWKNHIYSMNNGIVSSKYSNNNIGTDEQSVKAAFEEYINSEIEPKKRPLANMVVYELLKLRNGVNKNEEKLRPKLLIAKELFSEAPELGALILNFVLDENGEIYHSQPDTWQRYWGYNELYDDVFRIASNMNYGRVDFNTGTFQYTLWAWKGDYWNLQSGAEVGLYRYAFDSDDNPHYEAINFEVPMTFSLYNYYSKDNIINVFNWAPSINQWWITGFDPTEYLPDPDKMMMISSIDLSDRVGMYDALKASDDDEDYHDYLKSEHLIFDDETQTVWIQWYN